MSLSELRQKDVINTRDGHCLGKVMDLEFPTLPLPPSHSIEKSA